ncbi:MAG: SMC-Scp complex subunit ScpB, partial [Proteobacteria bacterium]
MAASASADALELTDADLEEASDERSDRLKELARRVAQTVSERKGELSAAGETIAEDFTLTEGAEPPLPDMEQMGFQALEEELEAAENDADPEPTEFVDNDQVISIIESMLFSTDKPVSVATIKAIFKGTNVRTKDIQRALDILASEYASPTRGVSLEEINGGYQLRTKVDNANFLKRLAKSRPFRLSGPALEVMAIVAYKQPVAKFEIDEIRGVESGHLLRALMERGMVSFQGKSETLPGKPMTYGSTRKFLETFGLRNLRELPTLSEIDELLPEGIGEVEEKEKLSDITESLS